MKRILMIAFHFPPFQGSSGIQRTLKFARYLPDYGWQPIVLTANARAYPQVSDEQVRRIISELPVKRAFALDTAQHLSIRGSYLRWMALPDRWISWWVGAVPAGVRLIQKYRPEVIWSTYPIATAHLVGLTLHRLTGIPMIADFRDPMTEDDHPSDRVTRSVCRWIECLTIKRCTYGVFTAPGTLRMYAERYAEIPKCRWALIANGYDEEDFIVAEQAVVTRPSPRNRIVLVHSGVLYPSERDPRAFFAAVAELRRGGKISSSNLRIILRGSGNEGFYRHQLWENGIGDVVFLEPAIPYGDALTEMLNADGLLIFQASNCNDQIPAKIYEYLRAQRPIFALTDPKGDTAGVLRGAGIDTMASLDSKDEIAQGLVDFLIKVREGCAPIAREGEMARHSRKSRTQELVNLVESVSHRRAGGVMS